MRHKCAVLVVVTQLFKGLLLVQLSFYQSVKDSDLFCNHPSYRGWVGGCVSISLSGQNPQGPCERQGISLSVGT